MKKKALLLGLGISGTSAQKLLEKRGYEVVGVDDEKAPKEIDTLHEFSLFVPSPGVSRSHPLYQRALQAKIEIAGEAQLALSEVRAPCIGVTGTNGKTTIVEMIAHCLKKCGRPARAVGNVGEPIGSHIGEEEILVVELSSFQLETMKVKAFDLAFILNIEEDHLDRYESFEEYAKAKARLERCVKDGGEFYLSEPAWKRFGSLFTPSCSILRSGNSIIEILSHVADHFQIERELFLEARFSFSKRPHRLEWVRMVDGVSYYNDSKATNVAATLHGLRAISGKVVLLLGGQEKGLSFAPLLDANESLSFVIAFGAAREKIADALKPLIEVHQEEILSDALELAREKAKKGETILFSPGCASFDAYSGYEERGEEFKQLVKRLGDSS
ncbi:MAG: UDP-N-acetylmuramoylalanine--D-glutamate ligase [Chlamydiae bacterium]|nr:UDP-N-acetylmuramoylalanine--D-glutamate ligase [Chlamydiota bacterium]